MKNWPSSSFEIISVPFVSIASKSLFMVTTQAKIPNKSIIVKAHYILLLEWHHSHSNPEHWTFLGISLSIPEQKLTRERLFFQMLGHDRFGLTSIGSAFSKKLRFLSIFCLFELIFTFLLFKYPKDYEWYYHRNSKYSFITWPLNPMI